MIRVIVESGAKEGRSTVASAIARLLMSHGVEVEFKDGIGEPWKPDTRHFSRKDKIIVQTRMKKAVVHGEPV